MTSGAVVCQLVNDLVRVQRYSCLGLDFNMVARNDCETDCIENNVIDVAF